MIRSRYMTSSWKRRLDETRARERSCNVPWKPVRRSSIEVDVSNTDRAFGTIFGSEITKTLSGDDLEEDSYADQM